MFGGVELDKIYSQITSIAKQVDIKIVSLDDDNWPLIPVDMHASVHHAKILKVRMQ